MHLFKRRSTDGEVSVYLVPGSVPSAEGASDEVTRYRYVLPSAGTGGVLLRRHPVVILGIGTGKLFVPHSRCTVTISVLVVARLAARTMKPHIVDGLFDELTVRPSPVTNSWRRSWRASLKLLVPGYFSEVSPMQQTSR